MIEIIYKDGTSEQFAEANEWASEGYPNDIIAIIKRDFDEDGDYTEEEDKEIALINVSEIRCIKL